MAGTKNAAKTANCYGVPDCLIKELCICFASAVRTTPAGAGSNHGWLCFCSSHYFAVTIQNLLRAVWATSRLRNYSHTGFIRNCTLQFRGNVFQRLCCRMNSVIYSILRPRPGRRNRIEWSSYVTNIQRFNAAPSLFDAHCYVCSPNNLVVRTFYMHTVIA